eukprot:TRINITY_DN5446_c0_g1_i2.p1 TRINITY_DN5446_c0_g1~~TRINITY_DN5446_c0_g1_i2.p1  ORF type:complete len:292 (-),score=59.20 TRINITY_DN5446_c0_g1_i2:506-1381(-)
MGASGCKAARSLSQLEGDSGAASPESAVSLTAGDSPCVWSEEASRAGPGAELTAWVAAATDHAAEGNEPLGAEDAASETERRLIENMPVDREALAELLRNVFVVEPEGGAAASIRGSICEEEEEDKEAAGQLSPPQLLVRASRVLLRKRLSERSAPDVQERPAAAAKARLVRSYSTPEGVALPVGQTPQLPTLLTSRSLLEEADPPATTAPTPSAEHDEGRGGRCLEGARSRWIQGSSRGARAASHTAQPGQLQWSRRDDCPCSLATEATLARGCDGSWKDRSCQGGHKSS